MSNPQRSASQRKHQPNQPSTSTTTSTSNSKAKKPDPTTPPSRQKHPRHQSAVITANKPFDGTEVSTTDDSLHTPSSSSKTQLNANNAVPRDVYSHSQPSFTPDLDIDQDTHLSFSPSKARALAQQTQQFTQLKNWLSSLLPSSPAFPSSSSQQSISNEQINNKTKINNLNWEVSLSKWHHEFSALSQSDPTLSREIQQWMQDVMYLNRAADEKRKLLHAAHVEELQDREKCRRDVANEDGKKEGGEEDRDGDERQRQQQQQQQQQQQRRREEEAVNFNDNDGNEDDVITTKTPQIYETLINDILEHLTPEAQTSLTSLSTSSINLGYMPSSTVPFTSSSASTLSTQHSASTSTLNSNGAQQQQTTLLTTLSHPIIQLTTTLQENQSTHHSLTALQTQIQNHQIQLQRHLSEVNTVQAANKSQGEYLQAQTARHTREMRVIGAKVREYEDRIHVLERSRPTITTNDLGLRSGGGRDGGRSNSTKDLRAVGRKGGNLGVHAPANKSISQRRQDMGEGVIGVEDILRLQERVRRRKVDVDGLERRIRAFHGLPPDLEASRMEVKRAQAELDRLKMRREELFSSIGRQGGEMDA